MTCKTISSSRQAAAAAEELPMLNGWLEGARKEISKEERRQAKKEKKKRAETHTKKKKEPLEVADFPNFCVRRRKHLTHKHLTQTNIFLQIDFEIEIDSRF
jgi:hypothetical protein